MAKKLLHKTTEDEIKTAEDFLIRSNCSLLGGTMDSRHSLLTGLRLHL